MLIERKDLFTGDVYFIDQDDLSGRFGISFNRLKKLVECNPEEGWPKWKVDRRGSGSWSHVLVAAAGDYLPSMTTIDRYGYNICIYHIVWVFHTNGIWAQNEIDHKDGNHSNNKISNLREANQAQQTWNQKLRCTNTSGVKGVSWQPIMKRWRMKISAKGKGTLISFHKKFEDAVGARYAAEDEYHGEFALRRSRPEIKYIGLDLFA